MKQFQSFSLKNQLSPIALAKQVKRPSMRRNSVNVSPSGGSKDLKSSQSKGEGQEKQVSHLADLLKTIPFFRQQLEEGTKKGLA
mmetsp:Transcript_21716/g.33459  ORF Transcript_21716/g.33459 Transcript_21716/m.33459 type:complete len:84 (+) Transcript_21716:536-787(+)